MRAAEVGIEGLRLSKVMESPYEPEEGLLDEILGQGSIASQQVREPKPGWGGPLVHIGQPGLAGSFGSLVGGHRCLLCAHITWTNEDTKVLQVPGITARRIGVQQGSDLQFFVGAEGLEPPTFAL